MKWLETSCLNRGQAEARLPLLSQLTGWALTNSWLGAQVAHRAVPVPSTSRLSLGGAKLILGPCCLNLGAIPVAGSAPWGAAGRISVHTSPVHKPL